MKTKPLQSSKHAGELRALSKQMKEQHRNSAHTDHDLLNQLEAACDSLDLTFNTPSTKEQLLTGVEVSVSRISKLINELLLTELRTDKTFTSFRSSFELLIHC